MRATLAGVEITSDRTYSFDVRSPVLWKMLTKVDDYTTWWPWVRECRATELAVGEVWHFAIQPPLPYALRCSIHIQAIVEPELIEAEVSGDLRGWARVMMRGGQAAAETEVRVVTELTAVSAPVRIASRAFPGLARWGHDWVLDTAARQFATAAMSP